MSCMPPKRAEEHRSKVTIYEAPELPSASLSKVPSLQDNPYPVVAQYHEHDGAERQPVQRKGLTSQRQELAEEVDSESDMLLAHVTAIPSFSLPAIPEDDWLASLRTVVSQMAGRDYVQLGFVHLVIDFALIVRTRLRQRQE